MREDEERRMDRRKIGRKEGRKGREGEGMEGGNVDLVRFLLKRRKEGMKEGRKEGREEEI